MTRPYKRKSYCLCVRWGLPEVKILWPLDSGDSGSLIPFPNIVACMRPQICTKTKRPCGRHDSPPRWIGSEWAVIIQLPLCRILRRPSKSFFYQQNEGQAGSLRQAIRCFESHASFGGSFTAGGMWVQVRADWFLRRIQMNGNNRWSSGDVS